MDNLAKQSDIDKKSAAEKATADRVAAEKATADRVAAEKATADKAVADRVAAERGATQRAKSDTARTAIDTPSLPRSGVERWVYQTWFNGARAASRELKIEYKEGKAIASVDGLRSPCFNQPMEAIVTKTRDLTTIVIPPIIRGCDQFRFSIRNDGTGGEQLIAQGSDWVSDGFDHVLTPRK